MTNHYLETLPLATDARAALLHNAGITAGDDDVTALVKLHHALARLDPVQTTSPDTGVPAHVSIGSRLDTAYGAIRANAASTEPSAEPAPPLEHDSQGRTRLGAGPTPAHRSMASRPWVLGPIWRVYKTTDRWMHGGQKPVPYEAPDSPDPKGI